MTQSQIDLQLATETALRQSRACLLELRESGNQGANVTISQYAATQAQLKIDEALLWLREI